MDLKPKFRGDGFFKRPEHRGWGPHRRRWPYVAAAVVVFVGLVGIILALPGGAVGPPPGVNPPGLGGAQPPGLANTPFARYESVLTANRGGAAIQSVQAPPYSSAPTIIVTDAAGQYQATFHQGAFPRPSTLTQMDLGSDKATVWPVDPNTGAVAGPAAQSSYSSIGYRKPGPNDPTTPPGGLGGLTGNPKSAAAVVRLADQRRIGPGPDRLRLAGNYNLLSDFCVQQVIAPTLLLYVYWWLDGSTQISCIEPTEAIIAGQAEQAWFDWQWHNLNGASTTGGAVTYGVWVGTGILNECLDVGASGEYYFRSHGWGLIDFGGHYVGGNGYSNTPNPLWPCEDSDYFTGVDPG